MSAPPTVSSDVHGIRNAGWPTEREFQGHGVLMVVGGVTPSQGDGNADYRAKQDRSMSGLEIVT